MRAWETASSTSCADFEAIGFRKVTDSLVAAWMASTFIGDMNVVAKKNQKWHVPTSLVFEE